MRNHEADLAVKTAAAVGWQNNTASAKPAAAGTNKWYKKEREETVWRAEVDRAGGTSAGNGNSD